MRTTTDRISQGDAINAPATSGSHLHTAEADQRETDWTLVAQNPN